MTSSRIKLRPLSTAPRALAAALLFCTAFSFAETPPWERLLEPTEPDTEAIKQAAEASKAKSAAPEPAPQPAASDKKEQEKRDKEKREQEKKEQEKKEQEKRAQEKERKAQEKKEKERLRKEKKEQEKREKEKREKEKKSGAAKSAAPAPAAEEAPPPASAGPREWTPPSAEPAESKKQPEPAKPADPTKAEAPAPKPTEPAKPAEPGKAAKPAGQADDDDDDDAKAKPAGQAKTEAPAKPAEPAKSAEPPKAAAPVKPAEPVKAAEAQPKPAEPVKAEAQPKPAEPVKAEAQPKPAEPVKPEAQPKPAEPVKAEAPPKPAEPVKAEAPPKKPAEPVKAEAPPKPVEEPVAAEKSAERETFGEEGGRRRGKPAASGTVGTVFETSGSRLGIRAALGLGGLGWHKPLGIAPTVDTVIGRRISDSDKFLGFDEDGDANFSHISYGDSIGLGASLSGGVGVVLLSRINAALGVSCEVQYSFYVASGGVEYRKDKHTAHNDAPSWPVSEASVEMHSLEIPVLLRVNVGASLGYPVYAEAGPQFGFNVYARRVVYAGGTEFVADAEDAGGVLKIRKPNLNAFEFGPVLGAGFDLDRVSVGLRLYYGFIEYVKQEGGYPWSLTLGVTSFF